MVSLRCGTTPPTMRCGPAHHQMPEWGGLIVHDDDQGLLLGRLSATRNGSGSRQRPQWAGWIICNGLADSAYVARRLGPSGENKTIPSALREPACIRFHFLCGCSSPNDGSNVPPMDLSSTEQSVNAGRTDPQRLHPLPSPRPSLCEGHPPARRIESQRDTRCLPVESVLGAGMGARHQFEGRVAAPSDAWVIGRGTVSAHTHLWP